MRKSKEYEGVRFTPKAIKDIFGFFDRFLLTDYHKRYEVKELTTEMCGIVWEHYSDEALFKGYIPWITSITYKRTFLDYEFMLLTQEKSTFVGVKAHTLMQIQPIFHMTDKMVPEGTITWAEAIPNIRPLIIIGHGKGSSWRAIVDYLYTKHGYAFRAYELGNRLFRGLDKAMEGSVPDNTMAIIVMEKEDSYEDLTSEHKQIILNEFDYLENTLGTSNVLFVLENGLSRPRLSNKCEVLQFRYGHIKEILLQIAGKIRKEFN